MNASGYVHAVNVGSLPASAVCGARAEGARFTTDASSVSCPSCARVLGRPAAQVVALEPPPVVHAVAAPAPPPASAPDPVPPTPPGGGGGGPLTVLASEGVTQPALAGAICAYCGEPLAVSEAAGSGCPNRPRAPGRHPLPCEETYAPSLAERMTVVSQTPGEDDRFVERIDFPGCSTVKPGAFQERSFAVGRECRAVGLTLPRGLSLVRVVLKTGPRFRPADEAPGRTYTAYEGEDCLVFEGEAARGPDAGWRAVRLTPAAQAGLYLLVRNDTEDELVFEGSIRFSFDPVPRPEHEEV